MIDIQRLRQENQWRLDHEQKQLNPTQELKGGIYRNEAMVYLYYEKNKTFEYLAKATRLAVSTVKNYVLYKFIHLLDKAKELFNYAKKHYCYICKITFDNGKQWCKIGQSINPYDRAKNMKSSGWCNHQFKPNDVEMIKIIECKNETAAQNMEDCLRLGMTAINPDLYEKNDRLLNWEDDYPQRILKNIFVQMGLQQFAINE